MVVLSASMSPGAEERERERERDARRRRESQKPKLAEKSQVAVAQASSSAKVLQRASRNVRHIHSTRGLPRSLASLRKKGTASSVERRSYCGFVSFIAGAAANVGFYGAVHFDLIPIPCCV